MKLFKKHPLEVGTKLVVFHGAGLGVHGIGIPYKGNWPGPEYDKALLRLLVGDSARLVPQASYDAHPTWTVNNAEPPSELPDGFVFLPVYTGVGGFVFADKTKDPYYHAGL